MDILERLRSADKDSVQRANGSRIFGEAADEIERLRNQVSVAKLIVTAGVELMPYKRVGQWAGVRSFLEQETHDYEPFETPNATVSRPREGG